MPDPLGTTLEDYQPMFEAGRVATMINGNFAIAGIIANAPDPVFVSDLEGKILEANDAVSQLLGFRPDELLEQVYQMIAPSGPRIQAS